ncbi:MAG: pectinesterase family protein, partial [Bacteroidia bacterium]|nr:pectinesterase family protein [Bacteroidia bacterium]
MFKFLPAILILAFLPTWIIAGPAHTHQADLVVAADGSGDYTTLQAAIDAVPNNGTEEFILLIKKGIYTEKILIPASKTHLTLLGEDVDSTIIIWDDYSGKVVNGTTIGTSTSYTFRVDADYFKAQYLTFENNAGEVGQAVAVLVNGDKNIFYHCRLVGDQDTYYTKGYGRIYMKDCYIEGTTDFIFGRAVVVFDSCYVYSKKNSYITAASTEKEYAFGYVFFDCQLAGKPNTQVYLGRPWRPYAQTVFIRTFLDKHVYPAGWSEWNGNNNHDTCFYAEYNCFGPRALRTYRKSWSHELTEEQAAGYTLVNIFAQSTAPLVYSDDWIPQIDSLPYPPFVNIDWVNSIAELKETFQM